MTAPNPRRTRRRSVPGTSLPRPLRPDESALGQVPKRSRLPVSGHREHHVTIDYSYVQKDLITVAIVGAVAIAFIVAMAFSV